MNSLRADAIGASELIDKINSASSPKEIKDAFFSVSQLYFDGLLNLGEDRKTKEMRELTETMINCAKSVVYDFYIGDRGNIMNIKYPINEISQKIITISSGENVRHRHLNGYDEAVASSCSDVAAELYEKNINTVVPILSGGLEPAMLLAHNLNVKNVSPIRTHVGGTVDSENIINFYSFRESIDGKNILISDDVLQTGSTAKSVMSFVKEFNPNNIYLSNVVNYGLTGKALEMKEISENLFVSR